MSAFKKLSAKEASRVYRLLHSWMLMPLPVIYREDIVDASDGLAKQADLPLVYMWGESTSEDVITYNLAINAKLVRGEVGRVMNKFSKAFEEVVFEILKGLGPEAKQACDMVIEKEGKMPSQLWPVQTLLNRTFSAALPGMKYAFGANAAKS